MRASAAKTAAMDISVFTLNPLGNRYQFWQLAARQQYGRDCGKFIRNESSTTPRVRIPTAHAQPMKAR